MVLLEHTRDGTTEPPRLSQRDIATDVGTAWGMVQQLLAVRQQLLG